jgi:hypothetical protein
MTASEAVLKHGGGVTGPGDKNVLQASGFEEWTVSSRRAWWTCGYAEHITVPSQVMNYLKIYLHLLFTGMYC